MFTKHDELLPSGDQERIISLRLFKAGFQQLDTLKIIPLRKLQEIWHELEAVLNHEISEFASIKGSLKSVIPCLRIAFMLHKARTYKLTYSL